MEKNNNTGKKQRSTNQSLTRWQYLGKNEDFPRVVIDGPNGSLYCGCAWGLGGDLPQPVNDGHRFITDGEMD